MTQTDVLSAYESLSTITGAMLCAARDADWDRLVALEQCCASIVDKLREGGEAVPESDDLRRRKAALIRKVLADDAAIRDLTQPWLARLQSMIAGASRERRLANAYRPH